MGKAPAIIYKENFGSHIYKIPKIVILLHNTYLTMSNEEKIIEELLRRVKDLESRPIPPMPIYYPYIIPSTPPQYPYWPGSGGTGPMPLNYPINWC